MSASVLTVNVTLPPSLSTTSMVKDLAPSPMVAPSLATPFTTPLSFWPQPTITSTITSASTPVTIFFMFVTSKF